MISFNDEIGGGLVEPLGTGFEKSVY